MIKYETLLVAKPDITDEQIEELHVKLGKKLTERGGKEIAFQNWGKRKLAYEIKDNLKGVYLYYRYLGLGTVVGDIERMLSITEPVLRFISVSLSETIDAEAFDFEADRAGIYPFNARRPGRSDDHRDGFEDDGDDDFFGGDKSPVKSAAVAGPEDDRADVVSAVVEEE